MNRIFVAGAVISLVVGLLVLLPVAEWIEAAARATEALGLLGLAAFAGLYAVATVVAVPGSALTLFAGLVFGPVQGLAAVWVGATAGLALAFLAARRLGRERVRRFVAGRPSFAAVDRAVAREGGKIVFLTRLTPVFPFTFLNYAYGLTGVRFGSYLLASATGILPGTCLYIYLGYLGGAVARSGSEGADQLRLAIQVVGLAAFVVVTVLITRIARRALREAGIQAEAEAGRETAPGAGA